MHFLNPSFKSDLFQQNIFAVKTKVKYTDSQLCLAQLLLAGVNLGYMTILLAYGGVGKTCLAQFLIGQNLKWSILIVLEVEFNKSCPTLDICYS